MARSTKSIPLFGTLHLTDFVSFHGKPTDYSILNEPFQIKVAEVLNLDELGNALNKEDIFEAIKSAINEYSHFKHRLRSLPKPGDNRTALNKSLGSVRKAIEQLAKI